MVTVMWLCIGLIEMTDRDWVLIYENYRTDIHIYREKRSQHILQQQNKEERKVNHKIDISSSSFWLFCDIENLRLHNQMNRNTTQQQKIGLGRSHEYHKCSSVCWHTSKGEGRKTWENSYRWKKKNKIRTEEDVHKKMKTFIFFFKNFFFLSCSQGASEFLNKEKETSCYKKHIYI